MHNLHNYHVDVVRGDTYPLPSKRATASRIGYGGNAIVFVVYHVEKEFAVMSLMLCIVRNNDFNHADSQYLFSIMSSHHYKS